MRRQSLNRWHGNRLVRAFLFEHVAKDRRRRTAIAVPIEIHNIIKIARPRSFSERPQLFPESFLVSVSVDPAATFGAVGIRMEHLAPH